MNHRVKHFLRSGLLVLSLSSLSGCMFHFTKSADVDERETNNSVLVFGYLDDSEGPFNMDWGNIRQVRPVSDERIKEVRTNDKGLFYLENLPAVGSYQMEDVGGPEKGLFSNAVWTWHFPDPNRYPEFKRLQFKTKKPGLYYMGAYKLELVKKGGFFGPDKYELVVSKKMSEKDVLQNLLKNTKGTKWEHVVQKRIGQLK